MRKHSIYIISVLVLISCSVQEKLEWISTTDENSWVKKETSKQVYGDTEKTIIIKLSNTGQVIDGFGACFNELGWEALNMVSNTEKEEIIKEFFDLENGFKFNICRMPIGANDYAVDWYSHNETSNDFEMEYFSVERDKQRLIPYIKEAKSYNPNLKVWASPWCPPSWMKKNNHYACRPDVVNDLKDEGAGKEMETQFIMEEKYLFAYAKYFSKFIEAYKKEGIDIYAVHVQNEMNSCQNFPSCIWKPSSLARFIGEYMGPHFEEKGLNTEIWYGTVERPQIERVDTVLQDENAKKYIKGIGFQWSGKGAIPLVNEKYPDYKLMQTESECGDGSNDWAAAEHTYELIKHYFENGANSYMYWNMVLDETGKSKWGWKQNSLISIDSKTKEISRNPEFYLMKHFSHFIDPGAHKLILDEDDSNCLAFKNYESIIVFYYNKGESKNISIKVNDKEYKFALDTKSFNTFKISE